MIGPLQWIALKNKYYKECDLVGLYYLFMFAPKWVWIPNFILKKLASSVLKRGKEPNEIADTTFDAIKQNHFYILPHTTYDDMIKERFSRILARTEPQSADMQEILRGTLMGNKGEW